jgi:methyl-accepting chemotaxis protein
MAIQEITNTKDLFKDYGKVVSHVDDDVSEVNSISIPDGVTLPASFTRYKNILTSTKSNIESNQILQPIEDKINEIIGALNFAIEDFQSQIDDLKSNLQGTISNLNSKLKDAQDKADEAQQQAQQAQEDANKAKDDAKNAQDQADALKKVQEDEAKKAQSSGGATAKNTNTKTGLTAALGNLQQKK